MRLRRSFPSPMQPYTKLKQTLFGVFLTLILRPQVGALVFMTLLTMMVYYTTVFINKVLLYLKKKEEKKMNLINLLGLFATGDGVEPVPTNDTQEQKETPMSEENDCGCNDGNECAVQGHAYFHLDFPKTEVGCAEIYREFLPISGQPTPNEWQTVDLTTERINCIPNFAKIDEQDNSITICGEGCYNIYYDFGARFYQSVNLRIDLRLIDNGAPIAGTEVSTFILSGDNGALNLGSDICYKVPQGQRSSKIQLQVKISADTSIQTESRGRIKVTRLVNGLACPKHERH
jgi:hypothetical protein